MPQVEDSSKIQLVRIFAREDIHNKGIPVEIDMLLDPDAREIVSLRYAPYAHRRRPCMMFPFVYREGTWMHMGAPEMLANAQRVMNDIIRDTLNNNQIRNTNIYLARAGGPIQPDEPIHPGRLLFVGDIERDFTTKALGQGGVATGLSDLSVIQAWAERRSGMNDTNFGMERKSRTPATTMLAVLEQGNERVTAIIDRQREAQAEMWTQVHQLYAQQGDAEGLDQILGRADAEALRAAWADMKARDIRTKLITRAEVSTDNLNKALKRQDLAALLQQFDVYGQRMLQLAQAVRSTQDPVLRTLFLKMAAAGEFIWKRILNTYNIREQEDMAPELSQLVGTVPPGGPFNDGGITQPQPGAPAPAPEGILPGAVPTPGPVSAPGRPESGYPRTDGFGGS